MGKTKWINKKDALTFKLVHRPQNDPLIHDESAPSMILAPTAGGLNTSKSTKALDDLVSQLGPDAEGIRENEGEAAAYGVYYDDTEYDYMQHLRDPGTLGSGVVLMEAKPENEEKSKGRKQSLHEALKHIDLKNKSENLIDEEMLPSKNLQRLTYQTQQEIPDAIAGFQPDMDPRLREVLEALEDDAYVDNDDEVVFDNLSKDAMDQRSHETRGMGDGFWEDEDGWESDATERPSKSGNDINLTQNARDSLEASEEDDEVPELVSSSATAELTKANQNPDWLADFQKFKSQKASPPNLQGQRRPQNNYDGLSSIITSSTALTGRKKKRKGALTNPSNYSMSSSVLSRTEHQRILDDRFDSLKERWDGDIDDRASGITGLSTVTTAPREDFNVIVDEFLGEFGVRGGSRGKKSVEAKQAAKVRGLAELDKMRKELGPPRLTGAGDRKR